MSNLVPTAWLNIFGPTDSPSWTMTSMGPTAYEVYDVWGGLVTGTSQGGTKLTIPAPAGGWAYGSYRVFLPALSWSTNFTIIDKTDSRFPTPPALPIRFIGSSLPEMRGVFGLGPGRLGVADIGDPAKYDGANDQLQIAQVGQSWYFNPAYADPARTREQFSLLGAELSPSPTTDAVQLYNGNGTSFGDESLLVYPASPTVNGTTTYVASGPGTTSGFKLTVRSPNSTTIVETFDNLPSTAAAQTATASSIWVRAFDSVRGGNPATTAPTAIGNTAKTRIASLAGQFYAAGVKWFEGPWNEPQNADSGQVAHAYKLWAASVKSGAPNAKTMGPGPVSYAQPFQSWITAFLSKVDRTYLDGVSVHAYNTHNGDVQLARRCMSELQSLLQAQGVANLPLWQTEQGWQWPWYGVDRSRAAIAYYLLFLLMQEQYGIPLERNYVWYDVDNYFWLMSLVKAESSQVLHPLAPAIRGLQAERHGKPYAGALDFGTPGNDHYVGNIYAAPDGSKSLAMVSCGEGDGGQVTFTVTGASFLVRVDCFGNQTGLPVTGGKVTVHIDNTPTYLRVPVGATAIPDKRDYGTELLSGAAVVASGGSKAPAARVTTPGLWSPYYLDSGYLLSDGQPNPYSPWQAASAALPQTVTITRAGSAVTANTVVVRAATLYQDLTTLLDFDVAVSPDGSTWNTVYTYTKNPLNSYVPRLGTEATQAGFQSRAEQWDDERWLWVANFSAQPVKAVRLTIRAVTPGGALDPTTSTAMQGSNTGGPTSTYPTLSAVQLYSAAVTAPPPPPPPASNPYVVLRIT